MAEIAEIVSTGGRLSGQMYAAIKERLLDGTYRSGQRMPLEDLTVEFGVSKQPVREAFRALATDGLLEIKPQIGTTVATYSPAEFALFYRLLAGFEGAAAEAAALHHTATQLSRMRHLLEEGSGGNSNPSSPAAALSLRKSNRQFHSMVNAMANSRLISLQSQRLWDLSDFLLSSLPAPQSVASHALTQHDEHWGLVAAFERRDAEAAQLLMTAHVRQIASIVTERLPD